MKNYPVILWDYFINHKYKDPLKPFSPNQDDSWLLTAIHVHGLRSNFHPKQLACNVVPTSSQSVLGEYLLPREKWGQRMENEWTWEAVWFCFKKKRQPVLGDVSWEWFSLLKIKPKLNLGYNSIYLKFTKYCGLYYVLNCSNAIATTRRSLSLSCQRRSGSCDPSYEGYSGSYHYWSFLQKQISPFWGYKKWLEVITCPVWWKFFPRSWMSQIFAGPFQTF